MFRIRQMVLSGLAMLYVLLLPPGAAAQDQTAEQLQMVFQTDTSDIVSLAMGSGDTLAIGYFSGMVDVFDAWGKRVATFDPASVPSSVGEFESDSLRALSWSRAIYEPRLAIQYGNGTVIIWNIATDQVQAIRDIDLIGGISLSPDGQILAAVTHTIEFQEPSSYLVVWDIEAGNKKTLAEYGPGPKVADATPVAVKKVDAPPVVAEWHPVKSNLLACGDLGGSVDLWDVDAQKVVATFPDVYADPAVSVGKIGLLGSISWSGDGSRLAVAYHEGMTLWKTDPIELLNAFQMPDSLWDVTLNHDGTRIALRDSDGVGVILSTSGVPVYRNNEGRAPLVWNANGSKLFFPRDDFTAKLLIVDSSTFSFPPAPTASAN